MESDNFLNSLRNWGSWQKQRAMRNGRTDQAKYKKEDNISRDKVVGWWQTGEKVNRQTTMWVTICGAQWNDLRKWAHNSNNKGRDRKDSTKDQPVLNCISLGCILRTRTFVQIACWGYFLSHMQKDKREGMMSHKIEKKRRDRQERL